VTEYLAPVPTQRGPLYAFIGDPGAFHERFADDVDRLVGDALSARAARPAAWHPAGGRPRRLARRLPAARPPYRTGPNHSVVAFVWYPGQCTPIHDHVSWCVVGVHEGTETQTPITVPKDADGLCLVETGRETAGTGSCSALNPPPENIHRVANAGATRAISSMCTARTSGGSARASTRPSTTCRPASSRGTSGQAWRER
jgi:hypothetical protein